MIAAFVPCPSNIAPPLISAPTCSGASAGPISELATMARVETSLPNAFPTAIGLTPGNTKGLLCSCTIDVLPEEEEIVNALLQKRHVNFPLLPFLGTI